MIPWLYTVADGVQLPPGLTRRNSLQRPQLGCLIKMPAFSLVELLTVMAVIVVLMALAVPAVTSLSKSNRLSTAGRLVSNLLTTARSEAINQGTRVQFRVVTSWTSGGMVDATHAYRKFSAWKWDRSLPTPAYVQISKWETLPEGIIFDNAANPAGTFPNAPTTNFQWGKSFLSGSLNNTLSGQTSGSATFDCACVEFQPTGATGFPVADQFVDLLLSEGFFQNGQVTHTRKGQPNWCQVQVTSLTGRITVSRP